MAFELKTGGGSGGGGSGGSGSGKQYKYTVPDYPEFNPVDLPGLDRSLANFEADRIAGPRLRLLNRGINRALQAASSRYGDSPAAYRKAISSALQGYQDALAPTIQAAQSAGLSRARQQQQIQAQEATLNAQQEWAREMAQYQAQLQANRDAMQAQLQQDLADMQADLARELEGLEDTDTGGNQQDLSAYPGMQSYTGGSVDTDSSGLYSNSTLNDYFRKLAQQQGKV